MKREFPLITLILFFLSFSLASCNTPSKQEPAKEDEQVTPSGEEGGDPEDPVDPDPEDPPTTYQKDEDGFYILEEDYFNASDNTSEVYIPEEVSEVDKYIPFKMYIGNKQVPIYNVMVNMSNTWTPNNYSRRKSGFASIGIKEKVNIKLQTNFAFLDDVVIRPIGRSVQYTLDNNRRVMSFSIEKTGQYVIEIRGNRILHFFVEDYDNMNKTQDSGTMYFAPGIHTKSNDSRINGSNAINLSSGAKVQFAPGAFVFAKFNANNASNIQIYGPGYVDGSIFDRDANRGTVLVPFDFNYCSNVAIKDVACIDPAGWCYNMYFCNGVNISNIKIISSRSNGDGVSIQSCQNVEVSDSFVRSWDDSLVVKNYPRWDNRSVEGTTRSVHFNNCLIWTDLAQSMEVGYECVGEVMDDIIFNNITVMHNYHKAVFSIHNGNNANVTNVKFTNITVEDASMGKGDGNRYLIDFRNVHSSTWSDQHKVTPLGSVDTVLLENILVLKGIENPLIAVEGCLEARSQYPNVGHYVKNVTIKDLCLYDSILTSSYIGIRTNQYTTNFNVASTGNAITGAEY